MMAQRKNITQRVGVGMASTTLGAGTLLDSKYIILYEAPDVERRQTTSA